uniref:APETALA3/PISTILLATA-like protein 1 n=2 Tax=Welwitschia mirabilis TaxID=3377 RepID=T2C761_WELMI|nr:APETALA3/PISTILLATA-like protein 1 [Welwitschia mirabilis]
MGRGKVELKEIDNDSNRQVTFSKRRNGLFKKAEELSILCRADVGVIIFSSTGKLYEFCNSSMNHVLEKYHKAPGKEHCDIELRKMSKQLVKERSEKEKLDSKLRYMTGEDIEELKVPELEKLEKELDAALKKVRRRKDKAWDDRTRLHQRKVKFQLDWWKRYRQQLSCAEADDAIEEAKQNIALQFYNPRNWMQAYADVDALIEEAKQSTGLEPYDDNNNQRRNWMQATAIGESASHTTFRVQPWQPNLQNNTY